MECIGSGSGFRGTTLSLVVPECIEPSLASMHPSFKRCDMCGTYWGMVARGWNGNARDLHISRVPGRCGRGVQAAACSRMIVQGRPARLLRVRLPYREISVLRLTTSPVPPTSVSMLRLRGISYRRARRGSSLVQGYRHEIGESTSSLPKGYVDSPVFASNPKIPSVLLCPSPTSFQQSPSRI